VIEIFQCDVDVPKLGAALQRRGICATTLPRHRLDAKLDQGAPAAVLLGSRGENLGAEIATVRHRWGGPLLIALKPGTMACPAEALDAGADDVVGLPAAICEIAARVAARLRPRPELPLQIGELRIERAERRVARAGKPVPLLPREYALLLHLAHRPGACVSRSELLGAVWGLDFDPGTNVVEVHVSRLRAKLDRGFSRPMLLTERRRGYRLDPIVAAAHPPR